MKNRRNLMTFCDLLPVISYKKSPVDAGPKNYFYAD